MPAPCPRCGLIAPCHCPRARIPHALAALAVPAALLLGAGAFGGAACNASSAQVGQTVSDGVALAGCVLSQVLAGITDPAQLLSCAGATEALIVDIIDDFMAQHTSDAGLAEVKSSLTAQQLQWLQQARANAVAALAKKQKEK